MSLTKKNLLSIYIDKTIVIISKFEEKTKMLFNEDFI